MRKNILTFVSACTLLFQVCGCTSWRWIPPDAAATVPLERQISIVTVEGERIRSDYGSYVPRPYVQSDTLYAMVDGQLEMIPLSRIRVFKHGRLDVLRTLITVTAGGIITFFIIDVIILGNIGISFDVGY